MDLSPLHNYSLMKQMVGWGNGMAEKRVLLVESGRFIGGVIQHLFSKNDQLRVIETAPASNRELLQAIREYKPEIVVLDDTLSCDFLAHLLRFMRVSKNLRVLVVNTNSNSVEVYQKELVDYHQTADFFAIL